MGAAIKSQVELKAEGKIRSAGIGVNDPGFALRVLRGAPPGALDAVMIAGCWNLLDQSAYPLLLECQARGVEVRCRMTLPPYRNACPRGRAGPCRAPHAARLPGLPAVGGFRPPPRRGLSDFLSSSFGLAFAVYLSKFDVKVLKYSGESLLVLQKFIYLY